MSKNSFYLTTAIDYVNAAPHLGHAYEKIATDVMARFQRLMGKDVFFLTGTDEHGSKVEKTARSKGMEPKAYTDAMAEEFKKAWAYLNLSYDRFIRTTDPDHYALVEKLWRKLTAQGDIYKASYTGNYCTGCETFLTARDLNDAGECTIHLSKPEAVEEENYFFKLTKYRDAIRAHIQQHPGFVQPDFRAQEVLTMLEDLEDISVSRSVHAVSWGIPVPDDPDQRIYVWIDALSNYITGVGCWKDETLFNKFWPADYHVIGKDILRFHAIYWPAMLMAAGIELPKSIFVHGFINLNDAKISKSLGNVISPQGLGERFELPNPDPIRYYLMTVAKFGQDGNFTEEDFKLTVNADLANNLGNLLNRTLNMTNKYFNGQVPDSTRASLEEGLLLPDWVGQIQADYEAFAFQQAAEKIFTWIDHANKYINIKEPWTLHKEGNVNELAQVIYTVLDTLRMAAIALSPITPTLSQEIWEQLGYTTPISSQTWADITERPLPSRQPIQLKGPILPRLESEIVGAGKKK